MSIVATYSCSFQLKTVCQVLGKLMTPISSCFEKSLASRLPKFRHLFEKKKLPVLSTPSLVILEFTACADTSKRQLKIRERERERERERD